MCFENTNINWALEPRDILSFASGVATASWGAAWKCDAVPAGFGDRAPAFVQAGCRRLRAVLHPLLDQMGLR